jgi:uncharacterized protein (TIGR02271 family)
VAKTVVGLFDTQAEAQAVVRDLIDNGFARENISIVANNDARTGVVTDSTLTSADNAAAGAGVGAATGGLVGGGIGLILGLIGATAIPVVGPIVAAGPLAAMLTGAGVGAITGGIIGALTGAGVPEEDARIFEAGVNRGGTLVMLNSPDDRADEAYDIMEDHGAVDIDERASTYDTAYAGDSSINQYAGSTTERTPIDMPSSNRDYVSSTEAKLADRKEATIPVVEESLQVGKREVPKNSVRVYSHVTEEPVQKQVQLRDEQVNVERRPANRPVTATDQAAFREGAIEITENKEVPVVNKQARVVEEVVVNKDVNTRTETVNDTVRRTDVDVQKTAGQTRKGTRSFEDYDADFRKHFQTTYPSSGLNYNDYSNGYRYGYDLANSGRYNGRNWTDIEGDVRKDWESRNPNNPWERFKASVRYAWDKATSALRDIADDADRSARY